MPSEGLLKIGALGDLKKEKNIYIYINKTGKRELQLVWVCFLLGLWGQEKTRPSRKSFSTPEKKAGTGRAVSTTQKQRRALGCAQVPLLKKKKKACVCGGTTPPPGNQKPGEGPRESKHLQTGGRDKQASGWGRKKGRNTLEQHPPALTMSNSPPLSQTSSFFQAVRIQEIPKEGRAEQTLCHGSFREQSHIQILRRVRASSEKAVDGNGLSDPCTMVPSGPYPWGMELVTRSNHCCNCKEVGRALETISSRVSKWFFSFAMEPSGEKKSQAGPRYAEEAKALGCSWLGPWPARPPLTWGGITENHGYRLPPCWTGGQTEACWGPQRSK